jgi:hypothetical protein
VPRTRSSPVAKHDDSRSTQARTNPLAHHRVGRRTAGGPGSRWQAVLVAIEYARVNGLEKSVALT